MTNENQWERLWQILKQQNCADPEKALRIVMLDEKAFKRAIKTLEKEKINEPG